MPDAARKQNAEMSALIELWRARKPEEYLGDAFSNGVAEADARVRVFLERQRRAYAEGRYLPLDGYTWVGIYALASRGGWRPSSALLASADPYAIEAGAPVTISKEEALALAESLTVAFQQAPLRYVTRAVPVVCDSTDEALSASEANRARMALLADQRADVEAVRDFATGGEFTIF